MYAQWSLTSYSITYNLNSGSISGQRTTYDITSSNYTIPIPSKSNNVFAGWTGTGLSEATQNVTISKGATGNRTYTANWKETESVNYSCTNLISTTTANGVTISKASIADKTDTSFAIFLSVTSGSPEYLEAPTWSTTNGQDDIVWVRLNKGTWSRCGTTFNYAGTFNNVQIDSYTTHIYVPNKGIVVAFGYVPNPTVTYNANGGASNTSVVVKKSQGVDLSAKTTRSGYTFVGYANQGSSKILTEFRPGDANRTIYAQWVKSSTTLN